MSDDTPEKAPEKPTVKFEAPPKWAEAMFGRVHEGIAASEARLNSRHDETDAKVDKCIHGLVTVTDEVERVKNDFHEFKGSVNVRLDGNSVRARAQSLHDGEQDTRLDKLSESQMAQLLKEIAKTPMGQKIANGVGALLLALIGFATVWLMAHGGGK